MKKVTKMVLMLCLVLSAAFSYAHSLARTENEKGKDGTPIEIIERASHGGSEKGNAIFSMIDGHTLTVVFSENLGQVTIEIAMVSGGIMENLWIVTPNGLQTYLPQTGDYIITFTLANGDEYYGEFTVTD
ncbi:MAG: DUF3244 domain-containing protein [Bacteroidales bacterium]|nr:DUF3244 domain-containing protein [Bacteroidales bacterium]